MAEAYRMAVAAQPGMRALVEYWVYVFHSTEFVPGLNDYNGSLLAVLQGLSGIGVHACAQDKISLKYASVTGVTVRGFSTGEGQHKSR
jgi:hypothetical protein